MMVFKVRHLKKSYKDRIVLDIDSLDLEGSRIYSLTGPNGAGKSTLLSILAFLAKPDSGTVEFSGQQVNYKKNRLLALRRRVVLVDQYPLLFTSPVWKNVEFGLRLRGVEKKERERLVREALVMVGMEDFHHAWAPTLSGGETKRVALARALVLRPEVLLCDEPTANVDHDNQGQVIDILKRMNRELGTSIIFATHYPDQAREIGDHCLVLQNGKLTDCEHENSFSAVIDWKGDGLSTCLLEGRVRLCLDVGHESSQKNQVRLSIDPELICLGKNGSDTVSENCLSGKLQSLQLREQQIELLVDVGVELKVRMDHAQYQEVPLRLGETVQLEIPSRAIQLEPAA